MMNLPLTFDFTGKVVVVTGAGGVLCSDMARAYAQAGAKVAALDLNEEAVVKLAAELTAEGFICKGYKANVLETESLEAVHQQVLADLKVQEKVHRSQHNQQLSKLQKNQWIKV